MRAEENSSFHKVALVLNEDYYQPLFALINSILENSISTFEFFVFHDGVSSFKLESLSSFVQRNHCRINFIEIPLSKIDTFEKMTNIKFTLHYGRLFIPEYIGETTGLVLYLDADIIALKDISPLFDIDLDNYYLAAVQDPLLPKILDGVVNYRDLVIPRDVKYFNSGLILFNINKWNSDDITLKMLEKLRDNKNYVRFWDQYIFNIFFWDKWKELHGSWNSFPEKTKNINDINILHFAGKKPWYPRYFSTIKRNIYANKYNTLLYADVYDKYFEPISNLCPKD